MSEEKKYAGVSPEGDFYKALRNMLLSFDALEDESIPVDEYPHYVFAKYYIDRIRALYKEENLHPISFMHIPFEMANGRRESIEEPVKQKYLCYINLLIKQYELTAQEQISEKIGRIYQNETKTASDIKRHLETYKELKGEKVFEFNTYSGWKKWNPRKWKIDGNEQQIASIEDLEQIGKEFEFSYAMARLASLCEAQKDKEPFKEKWIPYFWGMAGADKIYNPDSSNTDLEKLKDFLQKDYAVIVENDRELSIEYLKENLKFFNPYNMTLEEMNKYFICSIILCKEDKEKPEPVFFKQVCLLGRLNKIHCYPICFIESENKEDQENLRLKIKALKEIILGKKIKFPNEKKIKNIEDDWSRKVGFLGTKIQFKVLFRIICNLFEFDQQYENRKTTGNREQMERNKESVEKAKTSYVILDSIEYPLNSKADKKHRCFELIIMLICLYSSNPPKYNEVLASMEKNIFPRLKAAFEDPEKSLTFVDRVNEGIIPEIISFIGMLERIAKPIKFNKALEMEELQRIVSNSHFAEDANNSSVSLFRSRIFSGNIFKHPKIIKFITMVDFKRNLAWLDEFRVFVPKIKRNLFLGALKEAGISLDNEAVSTILKEQQNKLTKIDQIMNKISKISAQSGKINLENCNPE
jgi:hypothetical protein